MAKGDTWSIDPPHPTQVQNAAYHLNDYNLLINRLNNLLYALCYCDDGSRYTAASTIAQAVTNCQHYINRAGDLSLVVKLGQKSKKCCVYIHNVPKGTIPPPLQELRVELPHTITNRNHNRHSDTHRCDYSKSKCRATLQ